MVYFRSSITVFNWFNHHGTMAGPLTLFDPSCNSRQNQQFHRNRKLPNSGNTHKKLPCDRSRTAAIDFVILIVVIGAFGFLLYPYIKIICCRIDEICWTTVSVVKFEVCRAPMAYLCLGISLVFALMAAWGVSNCVSTKCKNPNCQGLRKAAEFDIQLETEDSVKNSSSDLLKDGDGKGIFRLSQEYQKELESELRKIAPPNGKAVLIFRARCGCSIGRMAVSGPKKVRKIKK